MPLEFTWPWDLMNQLDAVSQRLKRNDLELCLLITPGQKVRYAMRLGGPETGHWTKDIDPIAYLAMLIESPKELAGRARESHEHLEYHKTNIATIEAITRWTESKPETDLPGEKLIGRY